MNYLYIFEDGAMWQSTDPPSEEDIREIDEGILTVVVFKDNSFYEIGSDGVHSLIIKADAVH